MNLTFFVYTRRGANRASLFSLVLALALGLILVTGRICLAEKASVLNRINAAEASFNSMEIDSVLELPVTTVVAKESYQGGEFKVLARKDKINRFPCSSCHKDNDKKILVQDGALFTHADIRINHGRDKNALTCDECHSEKERDFLIDKQGRKIDFDHSYQLCGQCHFRPKRDWLGGAHGKRETYWAGERVVWNCTSCHNPHAPSFAQKMPATYSLPLDE